MPFTPLVSTPPDSWAYVIGGSRGVPPAAVRAQARRLSLAGATPALILDPREAVKVANDLYSRVGSVRYAVKAGPFACVVEALAIEGHGFDVASVDEINLVLAHSDSSRIVCSNPAMSPRELRSALALGVRLFVTDSPEHSLQLRDSAVSEGVDLGDVKVLVRLSLSDDSAHVKLSEKFGVSIEDAGAVVVNARELGFKVAGFSFHLGSQAKSASIAADASKAALALSVVHGMRDPIIDVGGGFPAPYVGEGDWRVFADALGAPLAVTGATVLCEPGRVIASAGSWLVATVISVATRGGVKFVHLDAGAYHGLLEASPLVGYQITFPVAVSGGTGELVAGRLVGPTCDSLDTLFTETVPVPCDIAVGYSVIFGGAGAYSVSCSSPFNGFAVPGVHVLEYD